MGKLAFIYPGQGAQFVGMGQDATEKYDSVRNVFHTATTALDIDMEQLVFRSSEETLKITENTQPALLTVCTALTRPLLDAGIFPDVAAGLSIGEYAAHVLSGTLEFTDAVRIVKLRGKYMQEEVPQGVGGMAAILGLDASIVEECCREAAENTGGMVVEPANYNCPGQIVIAGHLLALDVAMDLCNQKGAMRTIKLVVSAPFHCALLKGADEKLNQALDAVSFHIMKIPVVANVSAQYIEDSAQVRESLVRQISHPVRWEECVRTMIADGVNTFVEIGPGKTLAGFIKKIDRNVKVHNVSSAATIESTLQNLAS
jgi:[acyl-carrier-protein] S-malonyltransferase